MSQNFAQVYKKITKAWEKRKILRIKNLQLRQPLGSANDWPKQHKAKLLSNQTFSHKIKANNAEVNPAATHTNFNL